MLPATARTALAALIAVTAISSSSAYAPPPLPGTAAARLTGAPSLSLSSARRPARVAGRAIGATLSAEKSEKQVASVSEIQDEAKERQRRAERTKQLSALIGTNCPEEWISSEKVVKSTKEDTFAMQEMAVMSGPEGRHTICRVNYHDDDDGMYSVETEVGANGSRTLRRLGRAKLCKVDQALIEGLISSSS
uniref:Uncharacterized protein n=1 Tax=Hemiselmis tepida TaxID=464990 RepID=A0A7S0VRI4_9CRYP|mmetsp:Transcript_25395/g.64405  ORF Transcript_25395/g.64405 Transcript_25395/m.64405 type:complete len:192 (+) Transcript_25395:58-633(+)